MIAGSRPCAPRYFDVELISLPACDWPPAAKSVAWPPPIRSVADTSVPFNMAMIFSTGPPGANCTTMNVSNMIPNSVGIINKTRLRM